jgi:hypothetical protein
MKQHWGLELTDRYVREQQVSIPKFWATNNIYHSAKAALYKEWRVFKEYDNKMVKYKLDKEYGLAIAKVFPLGNSTPRSFKKRNFNNGQ